MACLRARQLAAGAFLVLVALVTTGAAFAAECQGGEPALRGLVHAGVRAGRARCTGRSTGGLEPRTSSARQEAKSVSELATIASTVFAQ